MSTAHFDLAQACLEGRQLTFDELKRLLGELKADRCFDLAGRVLDFAVDWPDAVLGGVPVEFAPRIWMQQQRALCTYNDANRPPLVALREALDILDGIGLFEPGTRNAETLSLGGAVYKRLWEQEGNIGSLHSALALYRAGWERNPQQDRGYCGVNAAYVLDQLAFLAERSATGVNGDRQAVSELRQQATSLRRAILAFLDAHGSAADAKGDIWSNLTRAELHFGLDEYAKAAELLHEVRDSRPEGWKAETAARQLVGLARCKGIEFVVSGAPENPGRQAWDALHALLGEDAHAVAGLARGRVGLALSGGGLRASFYHLGMLARLAEVDALRHVEVISTVSGGSIVGALYYLKLKQLLETKSDLTIQREDYLKIVADIQQEFFAATCGNLRVRALANLMASLRMMFTDYNRSHRMGELYEQEIYRRAASGVRAAWSMADLLISPAGHDPSRAFKPNEENWRRRAKVPVLLVNSTALNSGHNFQFTANSMGEPPGLIGEAVDMNARYRRVYYRDAPTPQTRHFPLGHAVAASACVPVLFDPLGIEGLYAGRTVQLVDGGVHDNQGVAGLLDQHCDFVLCSDASGQMHDEKSPGIGTLGVAFRADEIAQDRVREAQYEDIAARERTGALRGLLFIHLKDGLDPAPIAPIGETEPPPAPPPCPNQTRYGIDRDIQRRLAELRTDLDSFTEVEAYSLMLSGYLSTAERLRQLDGRHRRKGGTGSWGGLDITAPQGDWPFLQLHPIVALPPDSTDLRRTDLATQLGVGKEQFFKAFRLIPALKWVAIFIALGVVGLIAWRFYSSRDGILINLTYGNAGLALLLVALATVFPLLRFLDPKSAVRNLLLKLALPLVGVVLANVHLWFIDPLFQARGRIERLMKLPAQRR